ncbi:DUF397 domain-containing protein [Amycolatopsis sp. H20-H5]|uniref:DUF397 domain-containing protein n=1 Tax=Amycolatopsis sp. H20-H5 TaxID=3046309 RepID=UPI002DBE6B6E|nr:DUF397 domain-containing protein [Amycolatopsis sp. H20-H5]MEC3978546.1 DUF397 domain-containing protein [Amycolatopsis sp. H20-H5]
MTITTWCKSSYSGTQVNCVEVAVAQVVRIRDTKDRTGGALALPANAWAAFVRGIAAPRP